MDTIDLSNFFHTKQEANDFLSRLATISTKIYQTNFNLENICMEELGIQKKELFISLLHTNNINSASSSDLKGFIDGIIEQIKVLPIISLTLAFEPSEKNLQEISEWFLLNTHKQMVFEIIVNPKLIAGAAINFKGKFVDYSVFPKFTQIVKSELETKQSNPLS